MFFKTCATLALATGFAVAKPISHPRVRDVTPVKRNGAAFNQDFSFIDGFNDFNNQQQVIQIQEQNLQIVDNGFQQQVVQQVNEVLIIDQQQNGFNNDLNNLFRKSNFNNQFQDQSTVILMVQEIQVAVDDGFGNQFEQNIFAQSALVANRGAFATQTVMVFASETIIAQNVINGVGGFDNFQNQFGQGGFNNNVALPTATNGVQLFGAKPTWSAVAEDPAAVLGGIWQKELADVNDINNNQGDNDLNNQAAEQEKKALDEANNEEENVDDQEDVAEGEENVDEEQAAEGEEAVEGEDQAAEGQEPPVERK